MKTSEGYLLERILYMLQLSAKPLMLRPLLYPETYINRRMISFYHLAYVRTQLAKYASRLYFTTELISDLK